MRIRVGAAVALGVCVGLLTGGLASTVARIDLARTDPARTTQDSPTSPSHLVAKSAQAVPAPVVAPPAARFDETAAPVVEFQRLDIQDAVLRGGDQPTEHAAGPLTDFRRDISEAERIGDHSLSVQASDSSAAAGTDLPEPFQIAQGAACETGAIPGLAFTVSANMIGTGGQVILQDVTGLDPTQVSRRIWEVFRAPTAGIGDIATDQDDGVVPCGAAITVPPTTPVQARIIETDPAETTACFQFFQIGTFTVRLTVLTTGSFTPPFANDCVTEPDVVEVTGPSDPATFEVTDFICEQEGGGILPGNDWIPLLHIAMSFPEMTPAPRFLSRLEYFLDTAQNLADSAVIGTDSRLFEDNILEFGMFLDRSPAGPGDSDVGPPDMLFNPGSTDGMLVFTATGPEFVPGIPFLRWQNTGEPDPDPDNSSLPPPGAPNPTADMFASDRSPAGDADPLGQLHYDIDFVNDFRNLDGFASTPFLPFSSTERVFNPDGSVDIQGTVQRYLTAGVADNDFEGYFLAVRLNQSIQTGQSLRVVVTNAEMVTVGPSLPPFNQPTPGEFPVNDMEEPIDQYMPNFYAAPPEALAEECGRVVDLEIYDITGSVTGAYNPAGVPDRDINAWNWPNRLYTPVAEYARPRFDIPGLAFDVFGGEFMDLRRIFALEQWTPVIGINAHGPLSQIAEVNVIFTDIGGDPFGAPGNGGFDPRQGFDPFTTETTPIPGVDDSAIGNDYSFNGVWLFYDGGGGMTAPDGPCPGDCNGDGVFTPPTQLAGGGVQFETLDWPMNPDPRFPVPDQSIPGLLEWEYIPFPPGGGDPWWKIKLRFAGGRRGTSMPPNMECTGELELCQEPIMPPPPLFRSLDYFIVFRPDSGYRDVSLRPGDGVGLPIGADFRAFVEPRRTNPLTNGQDGGIFFGPGPNSAGVAPTIARGPNDTLPGGGLAGDAGNQFEPWWHERSINQNNVKPLRGGLEIHDLVLTYSSDNDFAKETSIVVGDGTVERGVFGVIGNSLVFDEFNVASENVHSESLNVENLAPFSDIPDHVVFELPTYFDLWLDPFRVLRQHFFDRNSVGVTRDLSDGLVIPFDQQYEHQWAFESVPFFNVFFDGDQPLLADEPRSNLYRMPQRQPTLPAYNPANFDPDVSPNEPDIGEWPPQFRPLTGNIGPFAASGLDNGFVTAVNPNGTADERDDIFTFTISNAIFGPDLVGAWLVDQKNGKYRIVGTSGNSLMVLRGQSIEASIFAPPLGTRWLVVSDTLTQGQYPRLTDWPVGYKGVPVDDDGDGFADEFGARAARILKQHIDSPDPFMEELGFDGQTAMLGINVVGADDIIVNSAESQRLFVERITVAFWGPDFEPRRDLQSLDTTGTSQNSGVLLYEDSGSASFDDSPVVGDGVFGGVNGGDRIVPLKNLQWPLSPELIDIDGDLIPDDLSGDGILNPPGVGADPMDLNGDGLINGLDGLDLAWVLRMIPDDAWIVPFTDSSFDLLSTIIGQVPFNGFPQGDPDDDGEPPMPMTSVVGPLADSAKQAGLLSSYFSTAVSASQVQTFGGTLWDYGAAPSTQATKAINTVTNEGDDLFVVVQTSRNIARFKQFRALIPARLPARSPASEQIAGVEFRPINFPRTQSFIKSNPEEGAVQDFYGHDMLEANIPVSVLNLVTPDQTDILPGGPPRAILGIDASTNRGAAAVLGAGNDGTPTGVNTYSTPSRNWAGPDHDPNQVIDQWLVGLNTTDDRVEAFRITAFNESTLTLEGGRPDGSQWRVVRDPSFLEQVIVEFYDVGGDRKFNLNQDFLPLNFEDPANGVLSGVSIYRDNDFDPGNTNGVFDPGIDLPIDLDDPPILIGVIGEPETQVKFVFSSPGTDSLPLSDNGSPMHFSEQPRLRQIIPDSFGLNPSDPDFGPDFFVVIRPSLSMEEGDDFAAGIVAWGPNTPTEPDPDQFTGLTVPDADIRPTDFDIFSEFPWGSRALGFISFFKDPPINRFWTWDKDRQRVVAREEIDASQNHPDPVTFPDGLNPAFDRYWIRSTAAKFGVSDILVSLPAPIVDFDADRRRAEVGTPIQFTNLSEVDAASFLWNFGDGQASTLENPSHVYNAEGRYTVSLTVTTTSGLVVTEMKPDFIEILSAPFADFRADPTMGTLACDLETGADLFTVVFTDQSVTGPGLTIVERLWEFGDGTVDATNDPMPTHAYTSSGTFTVRLTVVFSDGSVDTCELTDLIVISPPPADRPDTDGDGVPDECDRCPDFDDNVDADDDGVPDGCDLCPDEDDSIDTDGDGVPDCVDACPDFDDNIDTDGDGIPDGCDLCEGEDDNVDSDGDGVPDCVDECPGSDDTVDTDGDGVPDGCDECPDFDDTIDSDGDGVPDGCDLCPNSDDTIDTDEDGVPDGCDLCPGEDDMMDQDGDGIPDGCDMCPGEDDTVDSDGDGVPDGCDACEGFNDADDEDGDGVPDGCDLCPGFDDTLDEDNDGVPDGCDTGAASFEVSDSISAGEFDRNMHALVPLMDWMPLFNFNMAPENDDPTMGTIAQRFLETLTYRIIFDPEADIDEYNAFFAPIVTDFLEWGLFREEGDPEEDFDGSLDELTGPSDTLLFTWNNRGAPVGELISDFPGDIIYRLNFIGNGTPTNPQFPVVSGATTDGQSYIVAFRTSATFRSKIGLAYEVLDARMTPFPLDDMGEPEDDYTPDFPMGEILDEIGTRYSSNFEVYDHTGGPIDLSLMQPDPRINAWNYPLSIYTPHAEFTRPRPDLGQSLFDFVTGESLSLREILPLDGWASMLGINLHSSAQPLIGNRNIIWITNDDPPEPLVDLREVNVVFTDIGADPFGAQGNGGFDPTSGLEPFANPADLGVIVDVFAIGKDYAFNGAWVWHDTNGNGFFDPPTPNATGGANLVDLPMRPDFFSGHVPEWEYIPFPPGGGDPWWKVRLRFNGGARAASDALNGFVEYVPEPNEDQLEDAPFTDTIGNFERSDYFVAVRTDSGYRDVSLEPGDGTGIKPGADFKVFIEPRRLNPLTGSFDGGIHLDSMIPASDFFFGQTPWQDDPRWRNDLGEIEPWWPERSHDPFLTKPSRTGMEVHDLVQLYRSRNDAAVFTDIPFSGDFFEFERWLDPFGLIADQFLNPRELIAVFWAIRLNFSIPDINNPDMNFNFLLDNAGRRGRHEAFESVPFRLPGRDAPPFGPRSQFFPAEAMRPLPSLPTFGTWPATSGARDYPHFADWEREDRQARLLRQHIDSESQLTAMLGFNLAGSSDPEVNRVNRPVLDEIYVALWGPDFTPSDLLPLDPEGDDVNSGAMLWADSLDIGFTFEDDVLDSAPDGVFRGLPISTTFLDDPFVSDSIISLDNLRWQNAPEPIDLDGDGLADDMNGDEIVDQRDYAWVLQLTPQAALPIPINDQDVGDVDPEGEGPFNFHGDDAFFVIRTSKSVSRFEQFRAVVPASLPSRPESLRPAGIRMTPQGTAIASAYFKSHPEEQVAFNFYDHDMLKVNVPADMTNLAPRNTQVVSGGPAFPVFGLDFSTNRTNATVETGTNGTGGSRSFVDSSKAWTQDQFAGKWLIDQRFLGFEIMSNSATRLTLRGGTPATGRYRIVSEPTFLEQLIIELYRGSPESSFRMAADLLPLSQDQRVSGVAIYRDNDFNPQNRNGVFDPGIDIPISLDATPTNIGIGGRPDAQIKFVFSTPGTDNWPMPLADQTPRRQWVPDSFGTSESDPFTGPDFFVLIRPSRNLGAGDDFRLGVVSWGPNTPTEPDPDTFVFPPPPTQPADEYAKFSEFPFGNRAMGFITFFEQPETRYWMREARAFQEPEPDFVNWIRTTTSKKVLSGTLTARDPIIGPDTIEVDSFSNTQIPAVIPDGEFFPLVIRGTNFGTNPTVVIEGYEVEIVSATNDSISVRLRNIPGVTPTDPLVIIITNTQTGEVFSDVGGISTTGTMPASMEILSVSPSEGQRGDFPVAIRGVNFNPVDTFEVTFSGTIMPLVSVEPLGNQLEAGNGTASDQVTFTDIAKAWAVNQFEGQFLIDATNGTFEILSNDAMTLTLRPGSRVPVSGAYGIYDRNDFEAMVNFPNGGLPKTGAQDVTVRNKNTNGQVLSEDTMLGGFTFIDDPARPCFIATAAYGSPLEAELGTFRAFRDGVLLKSAAGVALVEAYYQWSPPAAEYIADRPELAWAVRALLTPVAWAMTSPVLALTFVLLLGVVCRAAKKVAAGRVVEVIP